MVSQGYNSRGRMISQVQSIIQNDTLSVRAQIADQIQSFYEEIADSTDWPELEGVAEHGLRKLDNADLASLEMGESDAPMPLEARRVTGIFIPALESELDKVSLNDLYRKLGSTLNTQSIPCWYAEAGYTAQYARLAASGTVTFKCSTTTNDDTATVSVDYVKSTSQTGQVFSTELTGTFSGSGLSISNMYAGWPIKRVRVPLNWDGTLTAEDGSANEIMKFEVSKDQSTATQNERYYDFSRQLIRIGPVPDQDYTAVIVYQRAPRPLMDDEDTPEIPVSQYLINMTASHMLRVDRQIDLARDFERRAETKAQRTKSAEPQRRFRTRPFGGNILTATRINPRRYL